MLSFSVIGIEYEIVDFLSKRYQAYEGEYKSHYECCVELAVIDSLCGVEVECEHSGDECDGIVEIFYSEEYPSYYS